MTVEEIVPLVEALPPQERARLLGLITPKLRPNNLSAGARTPLAQHGFSEQEDPLSWESEGWEDIL